MTITKMNWIRIERSRNRDEVVVVLCSSHTGEIHVVPLGLESRTFCMKGRRVSRCDNLYTMEPRVEKMTES